MRVVISHILGLVIALAPVLSVVVELVTRVDIEERHHVHHDTYVVSMTLTRTLMLVVGFAGILGTLVSWLCRVGIYGPVDVLVPLSFFATIELGILVFQIGLGRYQVTTYLDRITVRPLFGCTRTMRYRDIDHMDWRTHLTDDHVRDLQLWSKDGGKVTIWGILDIDQMLLRIDRFDVLEG